MAKTKTIDWISKIETASKIWDPWRATGDQIVKRYRLESSMKSGRALGSRRNGAFNILWSSVQTQKPALWSKAPKILAARRFKDPDAAGRLAAQVIERAANRLVEDSGMLGAFARAVLDVLLVGMGVVWVRFEADDVPPFPVEPVFAPPPEPGAEPGEQTGWSDPETGEEYPLDAPVRQTKDGFELEGEVENERVVVDSVYWKDFACANERCWADVVRRGWVARRQFFTRREGVKRFGEKFKQVVLTDSGDEQAGSARARAAAGPEDGRDDEKQGAVWEVWCAETKMRYFVAKGVDGYLEEPSDPLGLSGLFPCPEPAWSALTNEDLIPIPDFIQYAEQAYDLDRLSKRIRDMTAAIKATGLYDSSMQGIAKIADAKDGTLIPIQGSPRAEGAAGSGLQGAVVWTPVSEVAAAIVQLQQVLEHSKQQLYEISGLSDIIRGSVSPYEKAAASKIKAQYASQRLEQRRRSVERCARDAARIMVEIMLEHFPQELLRAQSGFDQLPEVIDMTAAEEAAVAQFQQAQQQAAMQQPPGGPPAPGALPPGPQPASGELHGAPSGGPPGGGMPPPPEPGTAAEQAWESALGVLLDERARGFRIDVETDSTVEIDAAAQIEERQAFLSAAGGFMSQVLPVVQNAPMLAPAVSEMLLFTIRGFRAGRTLEASFEQGVEGLQRMIEQQAANPQQPPPDPEAQAKAQAVQQKSQADAAAAQQKMAIEAERARSDAAAAQRQMDADAERDALEIQKLRAEVEFLRAKTPLEIAKKQAENEAARKRAQATPAKPPPRGGGRG